MPRGLVGASLGHVLDVTKGPPHLFDDFHVFKCRLQRFRGCVERIDCRVTGSLGGVSCVLSGQPRRLPEFAEPLTLFAEGLERFAMLVPDLPRLLGQQSELFRLISGRLGCGAVFFGDFAPLLRVLTAVLGLLATVLCVLAFLLWRDLIVRHLNFSRLGEPPQVSRLLTTARRISIVCGLSVSDSVVREMFGKAQAWPEFLHCLVR